MVCMIGVGVLLFSINGVQDPFEVTLTGLTGGEARPGDHASIGYTTDPVSATETVKWSNSSNPDDAATYGTGANPTDYTAGDGGRLYLHVTDTGGTVTRSALIAYADPVNTVAPTVSGASTLGSTLTSTNGTWTGSSISYSYQWKRDGVAIPGATASTYDLVQADSEAVMTCDVTATNSGGAVTQGSSNSVTAGLFQAPINTVLPTLSGTETVGQTLTVANGTWTGTATITYTYQWKRDGADISGETSSTYTLVAADYDAVITCEVTGTNSLGNSSATTAGTAAIAGIAPSFTVESAGSFSVDTYTITTGTATGTPTPTYSISVTKNSSPITPTGSGPWTIPATDGDSISWTVTATNAEGTDTSVGSETISSAWIPWDELTGVIGAYSAHDSSGYTETSGAVDQFTDRSGNANHMTASGSARPTLNAASKQIEFDGTDDYVITSGNVSGFTSGTGNRCLVAVGLNTAGGSGHLAGLSSANQAMAFNGLAATQTENSSRINTGRFNNGRAEPDADVAAGGSDTYSDSVSIFIMNYQTNHGSVTFRCNGAAVALDTANNPSNTVDLATSSRMFMGTNLTPSTWATGTFEEYDSKFFMVLDNVPLTADLERIEGWAAHEFGLTALLPSGHTYKSAAPTV